MSLLPALEAWAGPKEASEEEKWLTVNTPVAQDDLSGIICFFLIEK